VRLDPGDDFHDLRTPYQLSDLTIGPDGNMWGMEWCGRAVRVTLAGVVSTFPSFERGTGDTECDGKAIVSGPDGNVWFTSDDHIGRIALNPPPPREGCRRFTVSGSGARRTYTCGIYTLFTVPVFTADLPVGPDGDLWFTTDTGYGSPPAIGRFSLATHAVQLFRVPARNGNPFFIATGADGNLWFTTNAVNSSWLGRLTPSGSLRWVRPRA
jgi:virginiamycin B lyase